MKIGMYKGFEIWESDGHGRSTGTPGNYNKKTTGIQVRQPLKFGHMLKGTFNYPVKDWKKKQQAIDKAKKCIDNLINGK